MPNAGSAEVWRIFNATPDAHPVHPHLVFFQVLDRQKIDGGGFVPGKPDTPRPLGPPVAAPRDDARWKGTVIVNPGKPCVSPRASTHLDCACGIATSSSTRTTR